QQVPQDLATALRELAGRGSPDSRLALAKLSIEDDRPEIPTDHFLACIRFSDSDQSQAVDLLIARFDKATSTDKRAKVLRCWTALKPVREELRRRLVERVFIP